MPLPSKLFSHNDQQSVWQSDLPEGATSGWGGRIGDLMLAGNGGSVFSCISVTGNAVFLSGQQAVQYQLGSSGAVAINGIPSRCTAPATAQTALRSLIITASSSHLFEDEYTRVTRRSIDAEVQVSTRAGRAADAGHELRQPTTRWPSSCKMVARMIAARVDASARAVRSSWCRSGGFDLHDILPDNHPRLAEPAWPSAMNSFHDATVELGVADQVTAFTASDFGRTLSANGDGRDHGWGSHHLVLGGAVHGGRFYGSAPAVAVGRSRRRRPGPAAAEHRGRRVRRHAGQLVRRGARRSGDGGAEHRQLLDPEPRLRL